MRVERYVCKGCNQGFMYMFEDKHCIKNEDISEFIEHVIKCISESKNKLTEIEGVCNPPKNDLN